MTESAWVRGYSGVGLVLASVLDLQLSTLDERLNDFPERVATRAASTAERLDRRLSGPDRRRLSLRSFLKGGMTPRRRGGRRAGEHHLPIDWHEPYLLFLSIMILLLSVADAFLTLTLIMGGAEEANPFLAFVLADHPELFALVKMMLTGGGVVVLVAVARARLFRLMSVGTVLQGVFVAYVALIAYEWWLLSVLM